MERGGETKNKEDRQKVGNRGNEKERMKDEEGSGERER